MGADALRFMQITDLQRVLEIENKTYDYPWSGGIFRDCLNVGYCCLVYQRQDKVMGYGVMSVAAGESHILNICVDADGQRNGIGRQLLLRLLEMAQKLGAECSFLEVRPSNLAAVKLYESEGFLELAVRKNYYPSAEGKEDALVMRKNLAD
ncbi:MAG: ribosomal protein S18-alanine N-acetyltransferase [Gammaproteobacteria bacterium]|nr:ribosomal protein S18-alanine N-acetyltransferase [Gammaproteobacteria bacterium]